MGGGHHLFVFNVYIKMVVISELESEGLCSLEGLLLMGHSGTGKQFSHMDGAGDRFNKV